MTKEDKKRILFYILAYWLIYLVAVAHNAYAEPNPTQHIFCRDGICINTTTGDVTYMHKDKATGMKIMKVVPFPKLFPSQPCQYNYSYSFGGNHVPMECLTIPTREKGDGTIEMIPHDEWMEMVEKKYKEEQAKSFEKMNREAAQVKRDLERLGD